MLWDVATARLQDINRCSGQYWLTALMRSRGKSSQFEQATAVGRKRVSSATCCRYVTSLHDLTAPLHNVLDVVDVLQLSNLRVFLLRTVVVVVRH